MRTLEWKPSKHIICLTWFLCIISTATFAKEELICYTGSCTGTCKTSPSDVQDIIFCNPGDSFCYKEETYNGSLRFEPSQHLQLQLGPPYLISTKRGCHVNRYNRSLGCQILPNFSPPHHIRLCFCNTNLCNSASSPASRLGFMAIFAISFFCFASALVSK